MGRRLLPAVGLLVAMALSIAFVAPVQGVDLPRPQRYSSSTYACDLAFSPMSRAANVGSIVSFSLMIVDPYANFFDLYIAFDPDVLQVVDSVGNPATQIVPTLPSGWTAWKNAVDNSRGAIEFHAYAPLASVMSSTFTPGTVRFRKVGAATATTVRYVPPSDVGYRFSSCTGSLGSAVVTPADTTAPLISSVRHSPEPIYKQGCPSPTTTTVRAEVSDASGLDLVRVSYQLPGGSWTWAFMELESGHTYSAVLGPCTQTGTLNYQVKAVDREGNEAQSDISTATVINCGTSPRRAYLPLALKAWPRVCTEPSNNERVSACGPLLSGQTYQDYISSESDPRELFPCAPSQYWGEGIVAAAHIGVQ